MKTAKNLETVGSSKAAIGWYRRIVKEFPETPQAKEAAKRIKTLETSPETPNKS
jgi:TolA-binding protein